MKRIRNTCSLFVRGLCLATLAWCFGCGEVTASPDADPSVVPVDALPGGPDAAQNPDATPDAASGVCGLITFEDVLGVIDQANPQVSAPSPFTIDDATFTSTDSQNIFNSSATISGQPFTSDYFGIYTYNDGATLDFAVPIEYLRFEHGQRAVQTGASYQLVANNTILSQFTASDDNLGMVEANISPPADQVRIVWTGMGSTNFLNIDNLEYRSGGCSP